MQSWSRSRDDQLRRAKDVTAWTRLENAAEDRLEKTELLLNGLRRQSDLPADMTLTGGAAPLDQRQLDAIGLIERQPIGISAERTRRARGPSRNLRPLYSNGLSRASSAC